MNLSSFDYFVVLARQRSFTRAAQQLHITQQSLSSHIASLEKEFGCQLVIRHVPLELTYAGTVFLRYAENIQREMINLQREFCDITQNQKGVLKIGIAFTRGRTIMPDLISRFQEQYPNIEIELSEAANKTLYYHLLGGEIDLAIANFENVLQDVELCDFYREEVVLLISEALIKQIAPAGTANMERQIGNGDLSALRTCPFVLGNYDDIAGRIGHTLIENANFAPVIKARSDNIETLLSLCLKSIGACFCPANLVYAAVSPEELKKIRIFHLGKQAQYPIQFGFLKSNYQWKIISEFIRVSQEAMKE